jgi:hypothetical protein
MDEGWIGCPRRDWKDCPFCGGEIVLGRMLSQIAQIVNVNFVEVSQLLPMAKFLWHHQLPVSVSPPGREGIFVASGNPTEVCTLQTQVCAIITLNSLPVRASPRQVSWEPAPPCLPSFEPTET